MTNLRHWLLPVLLMVGLCSCKSELFERLDERDANEMLATLYAAGLHASKSTHDEKTWSVEVDEHVTARRSPRAGDKGGPTRTGTGLLVQLARTSVEALTRRTSADR